MSLPELVTPSAFLVSSAPMYEVKQAQVARAIDVLRAGPLTAAQFAIKMWPDRAAGRSPGQHAKMGHGLLRRLGELTYVDRVGHLWMVHRADGAVSSNGPAVHDDAYSHFTAGSTAGGLPVSLPVGLPNTSPNDQVQQQRLARLIQQATEPLAPVTHDVAFGDLAIRGVPLDAALLEACAVVVLAGRTLNVYLPCTAPQMLVGLSPAESARALFLTWTRSGNPPALPRPGAWITIDDGIVATPGFWRPQGASAGWIDPEDVRTRIARQRGAAGLA
jgi:hypothetical protein